MIRGFERTAFERFLEFHGLAQLFEEPGIDRGHLVDLRSCVAGAQGEAQIAEAIGGRRDELLRNEIDVEGFRAELLAGFEAANAFAEGFLERASDGHDFADGLHLRAERGVRAGEFFECPFWNFHDNVIDGGFEGCGRDFGDVVADLIEPVADCQFRGDFRDREAGGFRGERGTSRNARVHLDDDHAAIFRD